MIPSDLAARLRMLADATFFGTEQPVAALQRSREILSRLPELVPGQRFQATLQRTLPDGTFRAVVAGQQMTLALNASAQPGDTLELIVTETTPKAVFARLAEPEAPANQSSAQTALSQTGRLIGSLLTGQPAARPAALAGGQPLTPTPPTQAAALTPALRQAVSESGLFYEAHLAKWLSGQINTATLLREPQGQFANLLRVLQSAANAASPSGTSNPAASLPAGFGNASLPASLLASANAAASASNIPASALPGAAAPLPGFTAPQPGATVPLPPGALAAGLQTALTNDGEAVAEGSATPAAITTSGEAASSAAPRQAGAATTPAHSTAALARQAGTDETQDSARNPTEARPLSAAENTPRPGLIPERLMPVVHQQLDALATQTYVWQGQIWPGQTMEWEIEDGDRGHGEGEEESSDWNTTVRIRLPRLGGIEAQLHLTAAGVAVRLRAADAQTAELLAAGQGQLAQALDAADLPLTGMVVEHG